MHEVETWETPHRLLEDGGKSRVSE